MKRPFKVGDKVRLIPFHNSDAIGKITGFYDDTTFSIRAVLVKFGNREEFLWEDEIEHAD